MPCTKELFLKLSGKHIAILVADGVEGLDSFVLMTRFVVRSVFFLCVPALAQTQSDTAGAIWSIDNVTTIGSYPANVFGNPIVKELSYGNVVEFDGIDDGILVQGFPLNKELSFTAEVIFNPYDAFPDNSEQRFMHVQSPKHNNRRFLIELRLNDKKEWFIDTHIQADSAFLTCLAKEFPHPVDQWYHVVFTYADGVAKHYVNGVEEMRGNVQYIPVDSASVSLGMRMNTVSFFRGAIHSVAFSKRGLKPGGFLLSSQFAKIQKEREVDSVFQQTR